MLRLKVRTLEKYKTNYELLCSQLGELNDQIGLTLQQHEHDVASLSATIESLCARNAELEAAVAESDALLESQKHMVQQDRAYSERVHAQLSTAAELLKATESRLESKEAQMHQEIEALEAQVTNLQQKNEEFRTAQSALEQQFSTKLDEETQKREKRERKSKQHIADLRQELDTCASERETLCTLNRNMKKQLAHRVAEIETLTKQLNHVGADVAHLSEIINRQQEAAQQYEQTQIRRSKQVRQLEAVVNRATKQNESLQAELVASQEDLVRKNALIEALHSEVRALKSAEELQRRELSNAQASIERLTHQLRSLEADQRVEKRDLETQQQAKLRAYRKELHQMRQLVAVSHQKATESSKDVQSLKHELFGVQERLHAYHRGHDQWKEDLRGVEDPEEDEEQRELYVSAAKVEESVLKRAIMEQVQQQNDPAANAWQFFREKTVKKTAKHGRRN
uniref:Uncharacterized protein n=1 Tax=Globisporangium ultimum (strain ATCC 200006 / CBS 805.95 / DAOM BR144) TaxID=431595 RepID=K3WAH6_GLOUD